MCSLPQGLSSDCDTDVFFASRAVLKMGYKEAFCLNNCPQTAVQMCSLPQELSSDWGTDRLFVLITVLRLQNRWADRLKNCLQTAVHQEEGKYSQDNVT